YSLLVPAGSTIGSLEDTDQAGRGPGLGCGAAWARALRRLIARAELIGVELPESAFGLLRDQKVDALAFPRDQLIAFPGRLPGARVLAKGYGVNRVGIAGAKGSTGLLSSLSDFAA